MTLERIPEIPRPEGIADVKGVVSYLGRLATTLQDHMSMRPEDFNNFKNSIHYVDNLVTSVAQSGDTSVTLIIDTTKKISADLTIPVNVDLRFMEGGILSIDSGYTVTINGTVDAGLYQIFDGDGTVVFGSGVVSGVYPQWWGAYNDNTHSDETYNAINSAILSLGTNGGTCFFTQGIWSVDTKIATTYVSLIGLGNVSIYYTGTDYVISLVNASGITIDNIGLTPPANGVSGGIELIGDTRHCRIKRITMQPLGGVTTGIGINIEPGETGWIVAIYVEGVYIAHFKYGIKLTGFSGGTPGEATLLDFYNVWITGAVAAGSVGFWMDANCNGGGTTFQGAFESQETGFRHDTGAWGARVLAYFEACTTRWVLGTNFDGSIIPTLGQNGADGEIHLYKEGSVDFYQEKIVVGEYTRETRYNQKHVLYGYGDHPEFSVYVGGSIINGNLPSRIWGISSRGAAFDVNPDTNYMMVLGHKITWANSVPVAGAYKRGDIIYNAQVVAGGSSGWMCVTSGTFGAATDNTGDTDGSTAVITGMADTSDFLVDDFVNVSAGFPTTGPYRIKSKTAATITIDANSDSAQSNITVDTTDPTFKTMAIISA